MKKAEYTVQIDSADNGIIVQIGCKRLVFPETSIDEVLKDIRYYLVGGFEASRHLRKKWLNEEPPDVVSVSC